VIVPPNTGPSLNVQVIAEYYEAGVCTVTVVDPPKPKLTLSINATAVAGINLVKVDWEVYTNDGAFNKTVTTTNPHASNPFPSGTIETTIELPHVPSTVGDHIVFVKPHTTWHLFAGSVDIGGTVIPLDQEL